MASLKTTIHSNFKLTKDNYYSQSANFHYMSKSIYWNFRHGCEAEALAELKGEYKPINQSIQPLLFGNYLHSYFESPEAHEQFINENAKDLFKRGNKKNGLLKVYKLAQKCIKTLDHDNAFHKLYSLCDKEVIVKGQIDGINWMGKIDALDLQHGWFYDLKTVQNFHRKFWFHGHYTNYFFARGYNLQMAIYQELIYQTFGVWCKPFIIAVSKQQIPDKDMRQVSDEDMAGCLDDLKEHQQHIRNVIVGIDKPTKCGECEYCRQHKQLYDCLVNMHDFHDLKID